MPARHIFRIYFTSQGKSYELYAGQVNQGELVGFVEVQDIRFGERSALVVDPSEEQLKNEFGGVKRLLIPYHAVHRIEEVVKEGLGKVFTLPAAKESIPFPPHLPLPGGKPEE